MKGFIGCDTKQTMFSESTRSWLITLHAESVEASHETVDTSQSPFISILVVGITDTFFRFVFSQSGPLA